MLPTWWVGGVRLACATHPPTRSDPSPPGGWVRCAGPACPTHRPRGQHPAAGCCPPPRWAETNYPSVINQLLARVSPFLSMTEATSMLHPSTRVDHNLCREPCCTPLPINRQTRDGIATWSNNRAVQETPELLHCPSSGSTPDLKDWSNFSRGKTVLP